MEEGLAVTTTVAIAGFCAGLVFGATAQRTNFCTMGALSDIVFMGDHGRMRAWMLAIAVAVIGTQTLHAFGVIDVYQSIYLTGILGWFGALAGGLLFGFGMTLAGGCGNKTLVRIGGGNLKSFIVFLIMGIVAYMTLRGLTGLLRVQIETLTSINLAERGITSQGLADIGAVWFGFSRETLRWILVCVMAGGLLFYCFKDAGFRRSPTNLAAGLIVGLLVCSGWWITGVLGFDDFEPVPLTSFTFVSPSGESIQYLMIFTGATISFGIAAVGGVIAGSFLMAMATRSFHLESFANTDDLLRNISGAVLMGFGGVLAMGCTIGQGITGMSTLSIASLIALLAILAGGLLGLKYLEENSLLGAVKAVFAR